VEENIRWLARNFTDFNVSQLTLADVISMKARLAERGVGASRVASIIYALRAFLMYARDICRLPVVDLSGMKAPRPLRRSVEYLTEEEFRTFVDAIPLRTWTGRPRIAGYRFRALVETLFATGMRISEALGLDRDAIAGGQLQTTIVGKGNKERTVYFTKRALDCIAGYLDLRRDTHKALFATEEPARLTANAAQRMFNRHCKFIGMRKRVTPHLVRHTTATYLLKRGCPIGAIKEILGHNQLETTCRYYLGVLSVDDVRRLHQNHMTLDATARPSPTPPYEATPYVPLQSGR